MCFDIPPRRCRRRVCRSIYVPTALPIPDYAASECKEHFRKFNNIQIETHLGFALRHFKTDP